MSQGFRTIWNASGKDQTPRSPQPETYGEQDMATCNNPAEITRDNNAPLNGGRRICGAELTKVGR